MQIRTRLKQGSVIVYREKWGTLALGLALGLFCITFGAGFYHLAADYAGSSRPFLVVFCGVFLLAGIAILTRLPRQAGQMMTADGFNLLVADAKGLTLSQDFGLEPKHFLWQEIVGIIFAERMRIIESDETIFLRRAVVVFLPLDALKSMGWLERVKSGVSLSGGGRPYMLSDFPKGKGAAVAATLRQLVPNDLVVRVEAQVVFDKKQSVDRFAEL